MTSAVYFPSNLGSFLGPLRDPLGTPSFRYLIWFHKIPEIIQKKQIFEDAIAVSNSGAFAIVIECVVENLAKKITKNVSIPTIGIGASKYCDGQILVFDDLIGLNIINYRFVKKYTNIRNEISKAVLNYSKEVRKIKFPNKKNSY